MIATTAKVPAVTSWPGIPSAATAVHSPKTPSEIAVAITGITRLPRYDNAVPTTIGRMKFKDLGKYSKTARLYAAAVLVRPCDTVKAKRRTHSVPDSTAILST